MESVLAIGIGLGLRIVVDAATDDHRVGGVLVGLWEGVVLNHFVRKMPRSFDPYVALAFRVFVDFLFTQSLSRMALVVLWTLVGMLLADVTPSILRDSSLRRLYRRVRREARHFKRAIPDIRIKNDIPRVRFFSHRRRSSSPVSIRSDRAAPAQSPPPENTPMPGLPRRPSGRNPPGTFPGSSGWSETETEVTALRNRVVNFPGPSPSLIPTRVDAQLPLLNSSDLPGHGAQSEVLAATETQTQTILLETYDTEANPPALINPINEPSSDDPPAIPDDWVDVMPPLCPLLDQPAILPFAELREPPSSVLQLPTPPCPSSIAEPTPLISSIPDIPDADVKGGDASAPHQIPLPKSRAATVIGGVEEHLSSVHITHMEKASSELGVNPLRPVTPYPTLASTKLQYSLIESAEDGQSEVKSTKAVSIVGSQVDVLNVDAVTTTPTQVDPPVETTALNTPVDAPPLPPKLDTPADCGNADSSPGLSGDNANVVPNRDTTYLDPDPANDPPPPFSESADIEGVAGPSASVAQDEQVTELSGEQKVVEERRQIFLRKELEKRQSERSNLQTELDRVNNKESKNANASGLKKRLDEHQDVLNRLQARLSKKDFSETHTPCVIKVRNKPNNDPIKDVAEQILEGILRTDNADPVSVEVTLPPPRKGRKTKVDALQAFISEFDFPSSIKNDTMIIVV